MKYKLYSFEAVVTVKIRTASSSCWANTVLFRTVWQTTLSLSLVVLWHNTSLHIIYKDIILQVTEAWGEERECSWELHFSHQMFLSFHNYFPSINLRVRCRVILAVPGPLPIYVTSFSRSKWLPSSKSHCKSPSWLLNKQHYSTTAVQLAGSGSVLSRNWLGNYKCSHAVWRWLLVNSDNKLFHHRKMSNLMLQKQRKMIIMLAVLFRKNRENCADYGKLCQKLC